MLGQAIKVPWITSDLRKGMRDRDVAKPKAIKSNNPQDWAMYKGYVIGSMKKSNLQKHPIMLVRLFSLMAIHVKPGNRQKNNASVKELKLNENSETNSHELSNAFNDHFSTTGTKLAN